jgi:hypothetical protein
MGQPLRFFLKIFKILVKGKTRYALERAYSAPAPADA